MAQRVGRGVALLFHDRGTRRGWVVSSTPRPHFTPGKDPVPILREPGWAPGPVWTGGKSRTHRDSIPDRPARSQSLYRLSYPAHNNNNNNNNNYYWLEKDAEGSGQLQFEVPRRDVSEKRGKSRSPSTDNKTSGHKTNPWPPKHNSVCDTTIDVRQVVLICHWDGLCPTRWCRSDDKLTERMLRSSARVQAGSAADILRRRELQ